MNLHLIALSVYALGLMALGLWIGRRVHHSSDYKRFVSPGAGDDSVLLVARWTTLASAAIGVGLAIASASIVALLTIFYTLLTISLFVPVVAGLLIPSASARDALASIFAGVCGMLVIHLATGGRGLAG